MTPNEIHNYCMGKHLAQETYPFGKFPVCYKLGGKIFAQLYPSTPCFQITLKCTSDRGQFYRMLYPGQVTRGNHCPPAQQPYWNTVRLENFPSRDLLEMIDHAYDTVLNSFSKKQRDALMEIV